MIPKYARHLIKMVTDAANQGVVEFGEAYNQALEYLVGEDDPLYYTEFVRQLQEAVYQIYALGQNSGEYHNRIAYYNSIFFVDNLENFRNRFTDIPPVIGLNVIGALYNIDAATHDPNENREASVYAEHAGNATYGEGSVIVENTSPLFTVNEINGRETLVIGKN